MKKLMLLAAAVALSGLVSAGADAAEAKRAVRTCKNPCSNHFSVQKERPMRVTKGDGSLARNFAANAGYGGRQASK
jgi:hypothetical protein